MCKIIWHQTSYSSLYRKFSLYSTHKQRREKVVNCPFLRTKADAIHSLFHFFSSTFERLLCYCLLCNLTKIIRSCCTTALSPGVKGLRFLFVEDPKNALAGACEWRFTWVTFSASPFLLNAKMQKHIQGNIRRWIRV